MKKLTTLLLAFSLTAASVHANTLLNLNVGPRFSALTVQKKYEAPLLPLHGHYAALKSLRLDDFNKEVQVGAFSRLSLSLVQIQPEVLVRGNLALPSGNQQFDFTPTQVDMPVMGAISVLGPLRIHAGPVFSISKSENNENIIDTISGLHSNIKAQGEVSMSSIKKSILDNSSVGFQAGVGLDMGNLCVDVKYEGNPDELPRVIKNCLSANEAKHRKSSQQIVLSVGFKLF